MAYKSYRPKKKVIRDGYVPPYNAELLQNPIDTLELNEEVLEKLSAAGITTIFAVVMLTERALLHINRFNKKNLAVLVSALKSKGLDIRPMPQIDDAGGPSSTQSTPTKKTVPNQSGSRPQKDSEKRPLNKITEKEGSASQGNEKSGTGRENGTAKNRETQGTGKKSRDSRSSSNRGEKERQLRDGKGSSAGKDRQAEIQDRDEYLKVNKNGLWGFEDRQGKVVIPFLYDEVFSYKEDVCCVMKEDKYGFINRAGEVIIPIEYDLALSFSEGYACVFKEDKCGYIDIENKVIVPFLYDAGTSVNNGECRVKRTGSWGELRLDSPSEVRWII